tara:strand:- start:57 stop:1331 length:1275 start_codon:yes stop_codon:yes gene_type:complete
MTVYSKNVIHSPFSKTHLHDKKYKRIISVASKLFNVHGTRGTTLSQIANKLEFTQSSLYYYVHTKEDLIYQCYLNTCIEIKDILDEALSSPGLAIDKLEILFRLNFECWDDIFNGNRGHLVGFTEIASLSTEHQKEIHQYYHYFVIQVKALINDGVNDGSMQAKSPSKAAIAIWGNIFWLPVWLYDINKENRKSGCEEWLSIIKYGLKNTNKHFDFTTMAFGEGHEVPTGFYRNEQDSTKQEAFLIVGSHFFNKKGFRGTSLDELTRSLGVTKGAFYHHIINKEDLLSKCIDRTFSIEQSVLTDTITKDLNGINKLAYSARTMFAIQVGEQGPLIRYATIWSLPLAKREEKEVIARKIRDLFGAMVQSGIADKSIREVNLIVAENIIAGAIESIPDMTIAPQYIDITKDSVDFFDMFFNGIATK